MTVRDIEARLARDVEDKVSQRLGYREFDLWVANEVTPLDPRPEVTEIDPASQKFAIAEQVLATNYQASRPTTVYQIRIPRTVTGDRVRAPGVWRIQGLHGLTPLRIISITQKDSRWVVIASPNRKG